MFKTESLTVLKHKRGLRILVSVSLVQDEQLVLTETITFLLSGNTKVTVSDTIVSPVKWIKQNNTKLNSKIRSVRYGTSTVTLQLSRGNRIKGTGGTKRCHRFGVPERLRVKCFSRCAQPKQCAFHAKSKEPVQRSRTEPSTYCSGKHSSSSRLPQQGRADYDLVSIHC